MTSMPEQRLRTRPANCTRQTRGAADGSQGPAKKPGSGHGVCKVYNRGFCPQWRRCRLRSYTVKCPSRTAGHHALCRGTWHWHLLDGHAQRQVLRKRQAESSGVGAVPGPGPGGRSSLVGGVPGLAAACLDIPCSLVVPRGRHQFAPQSPGWARVCGTEDSGVWVLKGDARTYSLPRNLDDVGVVWEPRSGYETAWATPGHVCSCSYNYGRGAVLPQANPSVFTEADNQWSRVASLLTPWCAKGEVPTGVNLNRYSGNGSRIPWHCDNEGLFGHPFEPKSMSLGHSALFKLRPSRAGEYSLSYSVGSW